MKKLENVESLTFNQFINFLAENCNMKFGKIYVKRGQLYLCPYCFGICGIFRFKVEENNLISYDKV